MLSFEPPAARSWTFPRAVAGAALLVAEGHALGVSADRLLQGSGLAARDLADHERVITAEQELRVIRNLRSAAPAALGVRVGARYHASTFGPLGFALLSSPTLGDAANVALRFIDLSFTFTIPSAAVDGDEAVVSVEAAGVPEDLRPFLVERDLAAVWSVLRGIAGGRPTLRSVRLPFPVTSPAPYRAAFGVTPQVGGADTRATLRFDAAWLEEPLPQANPHAFALAERLCRDLVSPRRGHQGVAEHARVLIAQQLDTGAPMGAVAAGLGLSERSLRRRLADAGTSYRALLDEVRQGAAEDLLASGGARVEDVARRLGYAEASSFVVAYRRWTGRTPRARTP